MNATGFRGGRNDTFRWIILLLPAIAIASTLLSCEPKREVLCVRAIDGDTIVVEGGDRVRYIGIDTPELARGGKPDEYLAEEAKAFNRDMVEGKRVVLEFDRQERDRYGRLLAYVYVGEIMANEELVRRGLARARAYPPDVRYRERFESLEEEARSRGIGIWGRDQ